MNKIFDKTIEDVQYDISISELKRKLPLLINSILYSKSNNNTSINIDSTKYKWIVSIPSEFKYRLQSAYNCGLVAARVAVEYIVKRVIENDGAADLMDMAIGNGYSKEGEMFDAYHLSNVINTYYDGLVDCVVVDQPTPTEILQHLSKNLTILIPYDADKNWRPAKLNGYRPHWAAIIGFVIPSHSIVQSSNNTTNTTNNSSKLTLYWNNNNNNQSGNMFYINTVTTTSQSISGDNNDNLKSPINIETDDIFLICQHPKSKVTGLWEYSLMRDSNANLEVPDPQRYNENRWVIPPKLDNLKNKWLFLYNKE